MAQQASAGFGPPPTGPPATPAGTAHVEAPPVGPPTASPPKPRAWVLIGGGWMVICWFLLIGSAVMVDIEGIVLALIAMLPVQLLWRWRYWRTKQTPYYGATYAVKYEAEELSSDQEDYLRAHDPQLYRSYEAARELDGATLQHADHVKRGLGAIIAGYFLPMRDAVAEWRASQGKGRGARI